MYRACGEAGRERLALDPAIFRLRLFRGSGPVFAIILFDGEDRHERGVKEVDDLRAGKRTHPDGKVAPSAPADAEPAVHGEEEDWAALPAGQAECRADVAGRSRSD